MNTSINDVLIISCDESGNDGERLIGGAGPVFVHGSHDLTLNESAEIMSWLRAELNTRAPEIKFKQLVRGASSELLAELFGRRLAGRTNVNLTEKSYFVVGKVIDLLVEELKHAQGHDLYLGGQAKRMALSFYREGARALGQQPWVELLDSFNSLMRVNPGKNGTKTTLDEFFNLVDTFRWISHRRNVTDVLALVSSARVHAGAFQAALADSAFPSLDPLIPSLAQVVRHWFDSTSRPVQIVHDQTSTLSSTVNGQSELPMGGQQKCPLVAMRTARSRPTDLPTWGVVALAMRGRRRSSSSR